MENLESFRVKSDIVFASNRWIVKPTTLKEGGKRDVKYGFCAEAKLTTCI